VEGLGQPPVVDEGALSDQPADQALAPIALFIVAQSPVFSSRTNKGQTDCRERAVDDLEGLRWSNPKAPGEINEVLLSSGRGGAVDDHVLAFSGPE